MLKNNTWFIKQLLRNKLKIYHFLHSIKEITDLKLCYFQFLLSKYTTNVKISQKLQRSHNSQT